MFTSYKQWKQESDFLDYLLARRSAGFVIGVVDLHKTPLPLNFSYVCPEPVLAERSF
jgi:hypothetical protein